MAIELLDRFTKGSSFYRTPYRSDIKPTDISVVPLVFGSQEVEGTLLERLTYDLPEDNNRSCAVYQIIDRNSDLSSITPKLKCYRWDTQKVSDFAKSIIRSILSIDELVPKTLEYHTALGGYSVPNPMAQIIEFFDAAKTTKTQQLLSSILRIQGLEKQHGSSLQRTSHLSGGKLLTELGHIFGSLKKPIFYDDRDIEILQEGIRAWRDNFRDLYNQANIELQGHLQRIAGSTGIPKSDLTLLVNLAQLYIKSAYDYVERLVKDFDTSLTDLARQLTNINEIYPQIDENIYSGGLGQYLIDQNLTYLNVGIFGYTHRPPAIGDVDFEPIEYIPPNPDFGRMAISYFIYDVMNRPRGFQGNTHFYGLDFGFINFDKVGLIKGGERAWVEFAEKKNHLYVAYKASELIIYSAGEGGGNSLREFLSSGALGLAIGEIDELKYLRVDGNIVVQSFTEGMNRTYHPNLFGGLETGEGGIGSSASRGAGRRIGVWYGSQDQEPKSALDGTTNRNDYHYRGIAHISWDNYPWGSDPELPKISGMVTRIKKQTNGRPQWQEELANISTVDPDKEGKKRYIRIFTKPLYYKLWHDLERNIMLNIQRNISRKNWWVSVNGSPVFDTATIISTDWANYSTTENFETNPDYPSFGASYDEQRNTFVPPSFWWGKDIPDDIDEYSILAAAIGEGIRVITLPNVAAKDQKIYQMYDSRFIASRDRKERADQERSILPPNTVLIDTPWLTSSEESASAWYTKWQQDIDATDAADPTIHADNNTMNPVHALRELLTDEHWGFGNPEDMIDEESFLSAAWFIRYDDDEKIGFSYTNRNNLAADSLLNMLKEHMNCEVYYNFHTEKIHIKLIRPPAEPDKLPILDETKIASVSGFQRNYNVKPVTSVTVSYTNYAQESQSVTVVAPAHLTHGTSLKVDYPGCPNEGVALKLASRELGVLNNSALKLIVSVSAETAMDFNPGDALHLTWTPKNIEKLLMRVVSKVVSSEKTVNIVLLQDTFIPILETVSKSQSNIRIRTPRIGWGFNFGDNWGGN